MSGVITDALVLVVEERTCSRCGEKSRTSAGLFIRCQGRRGKTSYRHVAEIPVRSFLYCEKKVVRSEVGACESCFAAESEYQLALFPNTFGARFIELDFNPFPEEGGGNGVRNSSMKKATKPKKEVKMFQLSDF